MKVSFFLLIIILVFSCRQKSVNKEFIIGSWVTNSVYDSVKSIHTFDNLGNYLIDDSSNGVRQRKFTNRYEFSEDGKYLIVILSGGGRPQMEITRLTKNQLQLTIGSYTRMYKRN